MLSASTPSPDTGAVTTSEPVTPAEPAAPAEPAPVTEPDAAPPAVEEPAAPAPLPPAEPAEQADPLTAKRLDRIQREEHRVRAAIATERKALEAERASVEEARATAQRFAELSKRAQYDPVAVLSELKIDESRYEEIAKTLYALSPAGRKDPKLASEAESHMRLRSTGDKVSQLEETVAKLSARLEERDSHAEQERAVTAYLDDAMKVVTTLNGQAPIVKQLAAKSPDKLRARIRATAARLVAETGEAPEAEEVIAALEAERRAELEELGVDIAAFGGKHAPAPATATSGRTITSDLGAPAVKPRLTPTSREELRAEARRNLAKGVLE